MNQRISVLRLCSGYFPKASMGSSEWERDGLDLSSFLIRARTNCYAERLCFIECRHEPWVENAAVVIVE